MDLRRNDILGILVAAVALTACSGQDVLSPQQESPAAQQQGTVAFSTYVGRSEATRAGAPGPIDTDVLRRPDYGFGVFSLGTRPGGMHNVPIVYHSPSATWIYRNSSQVSFWPEGGEGRASFYAYAPYAVADGSETGILGFDSDQPLVNYRLAQEIPQTVDLLWATAENMTQEQTGGTVVLHFKHALAKIGGPYEGNEKNGSDEDATTPTNGLMVVLDVDREGSEFGQTLDPYAAGPKDDTPYNTKVTINAIALSSERQLTGVGRLRLLAGRPCDYTSIYTEPLANTGTFNLFSVAWWSVGHSLPSGTDRFSRVQTLLPEGVAEAGRQAVLAPEIAEPAAWANGHTREAFEALPVGVTGVPKNVYRPGSGEPLLFIPGTFPIITITIDYTVRTYDEHLADSYTEVRQRITKRLYILDEIEINKRYSILAHIGLTSVKFDATVSDWSSSGTTTPDSAPDVAVYDGEQVEHVFLPANVSAAP